MAQARASVATGFVPAYPAVRDKQAGFFETLYFLRKNPLDLLTRDLFEERIVERRLLGRRALMLCDGDLIRHFFRDASDTYTIDPIRKLLLRPGFGKGLASIDGPEWARNRALTKPYFSRSRLGGYAETFLASVNESANGIPDAAEIELQALVSQIAIVSASDCLFGSNTLSSPGSSVNAFQGVMEHQMRFGLADILMLPPRVPRLSKAKALGPLRSCRRIARAIVANNRPGRMGRDHDTLLDAYLSELRSKAGNGAIVDNVGTMLGAGFETTSLTMTWALYFLVCSPDWHARVRAEVGKADHWQVPHDSWHQHLPVLNAVLLETLRIYPILPAIVRYATVTDHVAGHAIRKGDFIVANLWALQRNVRYWDRPEVFDPGRFLEAGRAKGRQNAYFPFGLGPRVCIGSQFAMIEATIVLARLIELFDIRLAGPADVRPAWRGTLRPDRPIRVQMKRRAGGGGANPRSASA